MFSNLAETVSVIIPVYNTEQYLRQCLTSILGQTYPALQVICINDGSTDGSASILDEFAHDDNRMIVINQPNMGPPAARRAGLQFAAGDYVYFLDSDDWIAPDYIEKMLIPLEKYAVDLVFNKKVAKVFGEKKIPFCDSRNITVDGFYSFEYISPSLWSRLCRKSFVAECFKSIPANLLLEDVYIQYTYLRLQESFYCFSGSSYYYRFHNNSIMANYYKSFDMVLVVDAVYEFYKANGLLAKFHIPFELLYNKVEKHICKIEFQNNIRELLWKLADDFRGHNELYHDYTCNLTEAFLQSERDEDLTPQLRKFALAGLRKKITK